MRTALRDDIMQLILLLRGGKVHVDSLGCCFSPLDAVGLCELFAIVAQPVAILLICGIGLGVKDLVVSLVRRYVEVHA